MAQAVLPRKAYILGCFDTFLRLSSMGLSFFLSAARLCPTSPPLRRPTFASALTTQSTHNNTLRKAILDPPLLIGRARQARPITGEGGRRPGVLDSYLPRCPAALAQRFTRSMLCCGVCCPGRWRWQRLHRRAGRVHSHRGGTAAHAPPRVPRIRVSRAAGRVRICHWSA